MKKWIFSFVIVVANFLSAQSVAPVTGVPQFMGIPIEGDAVLFINKLKAKGFKVVKYDGVVTHMSGVFLGNVINEISIIHTPKYNIVWKVSWPANRKSVILNKFGICKNNDRVL